MSEPRNLFWKEVRKETWGLSREHFQWLYPIAAGGFALLVVWLVQGRQELLDNAIPLVAAGVFGFVAAVVVYPRNFVRATNIVVDRLRKAPYDEGLAVRAETVVPELVLLHVRHRIQTGYFSAQVWMANGGVPLVNLSHSLPWSDTPAPRRVLVHGEDHSLKVMRFEVSHSEDGRISVAGFICGAGGNDHRTSIMGEHVGNHYFRAHPILLHINITDSEEQVHMLLMRIDLKASQAKHASVSCHLIRQW